MSHSYAIEIYNLNVTTGVFSRFAALDSLYHNLTFFDTLNGIGGCSFDIPIQHPLATRSNFRRFANQIVVKRDDVIVWAGPITDIANDYENLTGALKVQANTYFFHLRDRYSGQFDTYSNQDLGAIAWDQISKAQARTDGNLGISQGTIQTSSSFDQNLQYQSIATTITGFSKYLTGFDFNLLPQVDSHNLLNGFTFNTYVPRLGSHRSDLPPLTVGGNLKKINLRTSQSIYNSGIANGSGTGAGVFTSQLDYFPSEAAYTRRETIQAYKSDSMPTVISSKLNAYLNQYSVERFLVELELYPGTHPYFNEIILGDRLLISSTIPQAPADSYLNFTQEAYVYQINVTVDNEGVEHMTPKVLLIS